MPVTKNPYFAHLHAETEKLKEQGLFKAERRLASPQGAHVKVSSGGKGPDKDFINLCANNYLGLANHPAVVRAAQSAVAEYGFGLASVRFICGTQELHKQLEAKIAAFLGVEDAILYSSCFDANGGLFETLLGEGDAIISDELNHASIIDGIRLCKASRHRYKNNDMGDLAAKLEAAKGARFKMVATDGVFSMDGTIANLPAICDLAEKHGALVMVDDSHAVGFMGAKGRGTHELKGVMGRVDIITGTLGKALGGASGGYTAGKREAIEWLRQRSRPYLFSNTLAPMIAAASLEVLDLIDRESGLRRRLADNAAFFRGALQKLGFTLIPGEHPIIPVMIGDAIKAKRLAEALLEEGVYVIAFSYPVVPEGKARIRTQMSAAHEPADLERAAVAFGKAGRAVGVIK